MQLTPARVAAIAVLGALAAAGTLELLRSRTPAPGEVVPAAPPGTEERPADPVEQRDDAAPRGPDAELAEEVAELERRIIRLEESLRSPRQPVETDPTRDRAALHDFVLDVMAEEREARHREAEEEAAAKKHEELEFDTRMRVAAVTEELSLADWEKERLVEILMEVETRRKELLEGVDPLTSSPEELERQMKDLDLLLRRRVEEELGPARALSLLGE